MTRRRSNHPPATLDIQPVDRYHRRPLQWLWPGRFPLRKLCLLSGDPNLGKSLITLDMAARISADRDWPDGTTVPRGGRALLLAAEDDVADTIRPRLESAGAQLDRIDVLAGAVDSHASGPRLVSLEQDVQALRAAALAGNYRLIVIDPITTYLEGTDMNSQQDVRGILHALAKLADDANAAVILVSHHRKWREKGPAIYRTLGALAFAAVARTVWNVVKDPTDPTRRLMVPVKMNLAPNPQGAAYRIVDPGRVEWDPNPLDLSADDISLQSLAETDADDRLRYAKTWLHDHLQAGPRFALDVKTAARRAGITHDALWKAKKALRVVSVRPEKTRHPRARRYEWRLPIHDCLLEGEAEMLLSPGTPSTATPDLDAFIADLCAPLDPRQHQQRTQSPN